MTNKIIIGILIFLVVLSGGLGYYSHALNQQINSLSEQLSEFHSEQAAKIGAVSNDLAALRDETRTNVTSIESELGKTQTRIGSVEEGIGDTLSKVDSLGQEISGTQDKITALEEEVGNIAAAVTESTLDASTIYERVTKATVRISNGSSTIGSGFVFDNKFHVLTAYHVIETLSSIYVIFADGRVSAATSTGSDPASDVAVLTLVDSIAIEPPPFADSAKVRIGEPVAAIGSPFDTPDTLTTGIVSQTNRFTEIGSNSQSRWVANLIQFDAAVNFGNSGCPLVNSKGEVIGLVVARVSPGEGDGIYYAVSSNKVKKVATALIAQGFFDYPWLGVEVANLTPQLVETRSLETSNGALVRGVTAQSPAAAAGIMVDDIIVNVDSFIIRYTSDLLSYLGEYKSPGDSANITLIRSTTRMVLPVQIGKKP